LASLIGGVQDLVVENGEVKGQTETDGVGGREISGDLRGLLVSLKRLVTSILSAISLLELSNITVVVTLINAREGQVSDLKINRGKNGAEKWEEICNLT
jgi:hypothetical protein